MAQLLSLIKVNMIGGLKEMSMGFHSGEDENTTEEEVIDFGDLNDGQKIDTNEVLKNNKEKFVEELREADLRNLIAYIELSGMSIKDVKGISESWQAKLAEIKKTESSFIKNPKLMLITNNTASNMALEELFERMKESI